MKSFLKSVHYAMSGIRYGFQKERNIRIHFFATLLVCLLAAYLGFSPMEWMVLSLTIGFVLTAELFNTAIEKAIDVATKDYHELAKIAKDVAAGAVLISAIVSIIVGYFLFAEKIIELFIA